MLRRANGHVHRQSCRNLHGGLAGHSPPSYARRLRGQMDSDCSFSVRGPPQAYRLRLCLVQAPRIFLCATFQFIMQDPVGIGEQGMWKEGRKEGSIFRIQNGPMRTNILICISKCTKLLLRSNIQALYRCDTSSLCVTLSSSTTTSKL